MWFGHNKTPLSDGFDGAITAFIGRRLRHQHDVCGLKGSTLSLHAPFGDIVLRTLFPCHDLMGIIHHKSRKAIKAGTIHRMAIPQKVIAVAMRWHFLIFIGINDDRRLSTELLTHEVSHIGRIDRERGRLLHHRFNARALPMHITGIHDGETANGVEMLYICEIVLMGFCENVDIGITGIDRRAKRLSGSSCPIAVTRILL